MQGSLFAPEIEELIRERKFTSIRDVFSQWPPHDVAQIISELSPEDQAVVFRVLRREAAAATFEYLDHESQEKLLEALTDEQVASILNDMSPDDRTALLEDLPVAVVRRLLAFLTPAKRSVAQALLNYPDESIGRLMTPNYLAIRSDWTAERVLAEIRRRGRDAETLNLLFVIDEDGRLIDEIALRDVLVSDPATLVSDLMDHKVFSLKPSSDQETAIEAFARLDRFAIPVVDEADHLLGIVTVDDVLDVAAEETTEDIHKGAAVAPLGLSYTESSVWLLFRKRIGWLLALVFVNLMSSGIIAAYEETLTAVIALAFFIPLLIDSGGNTGSQAATLMVRSIATGELPLSKWFKVVGKELFVGVALGVVMGLASAALGYMRGGVDIALVIGVSMVAIILATNLIGSLLPFALTKLRIDPAVASSPLITTVADGAGLLIYFSVATMMLSVTNGS